MSIHKRGTRFQVRYRDDTGRQTSRTFKRKGDAELFDAEIKRRRALGPTLVREFVRELDRRALTLDEFVRAGFRTHAVTLSPKTRRLYGWALRNHLAELLDVPLTDLDVPRLVAHQGWLLEHGRTPNTVRQAFMQLSGVMQVAVEHGHIPANPVRAMRKPSPVREEVRPLTPAQLERLADRFTGRERIIVLLAGHLGLRPLEVRSVKWENFDGRTLTVGRTQTKRAAARTRVLDVPAVTVAELKRWRLQAGRPRDTETICAIGEAGLRIWANHHLHAAARAVCDRDDVTPYTLRHTHASALHYCGFTVPQAAKRMGHSPVVHIQHYAHVIEQLGAQRYPDLDALIAAARNPTDSTEERISYER